MKITTRVPPIPRDKSLTAHLDKVPKERKRSPNPEALPDVPSALGRMTYIGAAGIDKQAGIGISHRQPKRPRRKHGKPPT